MSKGDPLIGGRERAPDRNERPGWLRRRMQRRRCRVVAGVVAVLVVLGVVLGVVGGAGGFGSAASGGGLARVGVLVSPTASLVVPFTPAPVGGLSAKAVAAGLPADLTVSMPGAHMKDAGTQKLADDTSTLVSFWVAAWASGNVSTPPYVGFCIMACRFFLDETVTLWARAQIRPAGTLKLYNLTGNTSYGGYNGAAVVCMDDAGLFAVSSSSGRAGYDPFHFGEVVLLVFTGLYDTAVKHWIMTQADVYPGDAYCGRTGTPNAPAR
jgi:hypothetical protein